MEPESQTVQTKRSQPLSKPPPPSSKPPPIALHPYKPQTFLKNISPYTVCILQANDHKDELYIYMSEVFLPLCPQVLCEVWKAISDSGGRQRVSSCFKTTTWHLPSSISRFVKPPLMLYFHLPSPWTACKILCFPTWEEALSAEEADTEPQNGQLVQTGDHILGEGQQAGEPVQLWVQAIAVALGWVGLGAFGWGRFDSEC